MTHRKCQKYLTSALVFKCIRPIKSSVTFNWSIKSSVPFNWPIKSIVTFNWPIISSVIFSTWFDRSVEKKNWWPSYTPTDLVTAVCSKTVKSFGTQPLICRIFSIQTYTVNLYFPFYCILFCFPPLIKFLLFICPSYQSIAFSASISPSILSTESFFTLGDFKVVWLLCNKYDIRFSYTTNVMQHAGVTRRRAGSSPL